MTSALYTGWVMHRRMQPRMHHFRYRAFWLLLDLDELPALDARLRFFSYNRTNLLALHDADFGDGSATPLRDQIARQLAGAGIALDGGRVRLLCMPRVLGHSFNPLSVYFCSDADGRPAAIVYEVHNTFGERHAYVFRLDGETASARQSCRKRFYVSPFLDMGLRYDFRISGPDDRLGVGIRVSAGPAPVLTAVMTGVRRELTDRMLLRSFLVMPAITLKVTAAIHWEALRLWAKGIRLQPRPRPPSAPTIVGPAPATTGAD